MRNTLSTSAVARLLGVAVGSVANWIDQGQLKAGRTPGGHRRVEAGDLVDFLNRQQLPVPPELITTPPRVLVVDDEKALATWIVDEIIAAHPDFEVRQANDGFAAGELVNALKPDVVFLDLRMPGLDGYEVCRRIKTSNETRHAVVIAMTAYHSSSVEQQITDCGAKVCLPKPLDVATLLQQLNAALPGKNRGYGYRRAGA